MNAPIIGNGVGPNVGGTVAPGFELVRERFIQSLASGKELGAAFAAVRNGELVVDLWGGVANRATQTPWSEDTLCTIFSGSKGLVGTCILQLIERQELDLDVPVCAYWPEFQQGGKSDVLVRHVVSHQAGLPGIRAKTTPSDLLDNVLMAERLASQETFWKPGSKLCYHPLTYGWLCGEIVRRISGMSIGDYFQQHIARPLNIETWIGVPPGVEGRMADCALAESWRGIAAEGPVGEISDQDLHDVWRNPELFDETELWWNRPEWRRGEIPGANAISSARAMAVHYDALTTAGQRGNVVGVVLGPDAVALGQRLLGEGVDPVSGDEMSFGVGWELQNGEQIFGPPRRAFGHGGAGGSIHGAWPEEQVGFSYVMNLMRDDEGDDRAANLLDGLFKCVRAD